MAGSSVASGTTHISLKMAKKMQQNDSGHTNGTAAREAAFAGTSPEHAVTFDVRDITDLQIPAFSMPESTKMANGESNVA
jgi:vacuolar-type H+-ATPase subunit D/Vma8